ncbi:MAG TPA: type II secretion system inner membrane protein GspF [Sphingomonadaceae bacterium]|nr:type II secretion system inner membrane protein GspF [Sphingomonadaceae bacterium]
MRRYAYLALDTAGRERRGSVRAETLGAARAQLDARRFHVVRIVAEADASALLSRRASSARRRLRTKDLTLFTRQLATLVQVTPLEEALRTVVRQAEGAKVRAVLGAVHAGVVEGRRLADAMAREPASFPPLYRAMIAAGEGSGALPTLLERVADLLERQAKIRGKIVTALAYPLILALVAAGVVTALMLFVVPEVVAQFDGVGQQLPLLTRIVIGISTFLARWWWALALGLVVAAFAAWRALRNPATRLAFDGALLRVPLLGRLIRDLHAARMSRTLATMVASRLPLLDGLALTIGTIRNHALRAATADIVEAVRGGGGLSAAFGRAGLFPPLLVHMMASGEASGRLDMMLERAADYLEREFDTFTATMLALLEPAIIVVMGGLVALIVLSILLPILQLDALAGAL